MALMFGMTAFGGLLESALSRLLRRLRPYLTTEISDLVVILIVVSMCSLGFRNLLGIGASQPVIHTGRGRRRFFRACKQSRSHNCGLFAVTPGPRYSGE